MMLCTVTANTCIPIPYRIATLTHAQLLIQGTTALRDCPVNCVNGLTWKPLHFYVTLVSLYSNNTHTSVPLYVLHAPWLYSPINTRGIGFFRYDSAHTKAPQSSSEASHWCLEPCSPRIGWHAFVGGYTSFDSDSHYRRRCVYWIVLKASVHLTSILPIQAESKIPFKIKAEKQNQPVCQNVYRILLL